jgi:hypothetical protein
MFPTSKKALRGCYWRKICFFNSPTLVTDIVPIRACNSIKLKTGPETRTVNASTGLSFHVFIRRYHKYRYSG